MTRAGDEALPTLPPPTHVPPGEVGQRLHIALERLPGPAYTWDDADEDDVVYDAPGDALVYDADFVGGGFTDAVCDFVAVTLEAGKPDEDGLVEAGTATITLDNRAGEYAQRDATGRLTYWALGRRVAIWADDDGSPWWLFNGRVSAWDEHTDATVTITAHDGFAQLAPDVGVTWTPGSNGQTVAQRITSICTAWAYTDPRDLETTAQTLANPATKRSPLEECQVAALSDGGVLFCDADGQLTYRGRTWTTGRSDQTTVHAVSDNYCDALVVWELQLITDDVGLASEVRLENWEATPKVAVASAPAGTWDRRFTYSHPEPDLWTNQADGNALASDLLTRYRTDAPRFAWQMHLRDPAQDLWRAGLDLRLGDLINVIRFQPSSDGPDSWLDVDCLVSTIGHEITPDAWLVTVETGRVVTYRYPELWDRTPFTWDAPDPLAVWRL